MSGEDSPDCQVGEFFAGAIMIFVAQAILVLTNSIEIFIASLSLQRKVELAERNQFLDSRPNNMSYHRSLAGLATDSAW